VAQSCHRKSPETFPLKSKIVDELDIKKSVKALYSENFESTKLLLAIESGEMEYNSVTGYFKLECD
jgi:hypothetical protein